MQLDAKRIPSSVKPRCVHCSFVVRLASTLAVTMGVVTLTSCDSVAPTATDNSASPNSTAPSTDTVTSPPPPAGETTSGNTTSPPPPPVVDGSSDSAMLAGKGIRTLSQTLAAVLPVGDLQAVLSGGMMLPQCPSLGIGTGSSSIPLTMDYGAGCRPSAFGSTTMVGTAEGTAYTAASAFDFAFVGLSVDEELLTGTIAGSFTRADASTEFAVSIDIKTADGTVTRGSSRATFDQAAGTMTLADTNLVVSAPADDPATVSTSNAVVDTKAAESFSPVEGSATVETTISSSGLTQQVSVTFGN